MLNYLKNQSNKIFNQYVFMYICKYLQIYSMINMLTSYLLFYVTK